MLRAPVHISHAAYEVVWEREELGVMPPSIAIDYPLRSAEAGAELAARAFGELQHSGLAHGDQLHPDLRDTLRALARAPLRYWTMLLAGPGSATGPLVAVDGAQAVLAQLGSTHLDLRPIAAESAVPTLVRRLPPAPPADGASISVREDAMTADGRPAEPEPHGVLVSATPRRTDLDRLHELMNTPRTFVGYLYAAARDGNGNEHRCPKPVVIFDIPDRGRWSMARSVRGGAAWVTAAPATADRIADQLGELAQTVASSS